MYVEGLVFMKNFVVSAIYALSLWLFVGLGLVELLPQNNHALLAMISPIFTTVIGGLVYKRLVRIGGHR